MARRGYTGEFRRRVLDLIASGRRVSDVARDPGGERPDCLQLAPAGAHRPGARGRPLVGGAGRTVRGAATHPRARNGAGDSPKGGRVAGGEHKPKSRFAAVEVIVQQGLPAQLTCRVLKVSESGYYAKRSRPPSARALRHALLTEAIREVHAASRQVYGVRRVHAELTLGRGLSVGRFAVELLMQRAGLQGISGRPKFRRVPGVVTADRVDRQFRRDHRDELWVTDITEHPTREGKVYCAVVLDAWSRRVVGWSIDARPSTALVTDALSMAIEQRRPQGATIIHSDQGTQFTSWAYATGDRVLPGTV